MSGDINWSSVVFATHCDGANGSTSVTDAKGHTVTVSGGLQVSTAASVFGGASLSFNGTDAYFTITDSGAFSFDGDFTIQFRARGDVVSKCVLSNTAGTYLYNNQLSIANTTVISAMSLSSGSTVFRDYEISRSGTTVRVFEDGALKGSGTYSGTADFTNLVFGRYAPNGNLYFSGYVDEIRITGGLARHTAAFTPATAEFDFFAPSYDGTGAILIPVTVNGVGHYKAVGSGAITVQVGVAGSGAVVYKGVADVSLASLRASGTGMHPFYADGDGVVPLSASGSGWFLVSGDGLAQLMFSGDGVGSFPITSQAIARLVFRAAGVGQVPPSGRGAAKVPLLGVAIGKLGVKGAASCQLKLRARGLA